MEKKEKKITKHVRVEQKWHKTLKMYAVTNGMTVTQALTKVCKEFFDGPATV